MTRPTIVCVYRTDPRGIYGREWVHSLRMQIFDKTSVGYDFVCLSDDTSVGLWRTPLDHDFEGWWSKIEIFRPGRFQGRVLYLDLDTIVLGDLAPILTYRGPMLWLEDFYQTGRLASGVITWTGDEGAQIYRTFLETGPASIINGHRSRSDHWYRKVVPEPRFLQSAFPGMIVSLKRDAMGAPPDKARIVCGHGNPRLSQTSAGWAHQHWRRFV